MIDNGSYHNHPLSYVRLRSAVYVENDGQVLLVHDPNYRGGCWILPGGGIEFEETAVQGAEREVLEETGLIVKVYSLWRLREIWEPETLTNDNSVKIRKSIELIFIGDYISGEIDITKSADLREEGRQVVKECRWVPLKELSSTINGMPVYPNELFEQQHLSNVKGIPLDNFLLSALDLRERL